MECSRGDALLVQRCGHVVCSNLSHPRTHSCRKQDSLLGARNHIRAQQTNLILNSRTTYSQHKSHSNVVLQTCVLKGKYRSEDAEVKGGMIHGVRGSGERKDTLRSTKTTDNGIMWPLFLAVCISSKSSITTSSTRFGSEVFCSPCRTLAVGVLTCPTCKPSITATTFNPSVTNTNSVNLNHTGPQVSLACSSSSRHAHSCSVYSQNSSSASWRD